MHNNTKLSLGRIDRFVKEWIAPATVATEQTLEISSWQAPDEPVTFLEASRQEFEPFALGQSWGLPWGTTWFHVRGQIPTDWPRPGTRAEIVVDLGFSDQQPGFQAEGSAWSTRGDLLKGISPRNSFVPLAAVSQGEKVDFYIEGAANPDVPGSQWTKPTKMGDKVTAGVKLQYQMRKLSIALIDLETEALLADSVALRGLVDVLPDSSPRRAQILESLQNMCDAVDPDNVRETAAAGRAELAESLAAPAHLSAHQVHAVGHAHIDSAWLWPTRETERKVGRTVGNVLALMDEDPEFKYAFSSAQQYAWIKERYPSLYVRLKEKVAEGRIIPVGGMWVESDTNMVGGESLVRQFVEGQGFFEKEFGLVCSNVWLPDSFGYTGAFPQIAHLAGADDFLTQKLSWNDTNRVPHSTFWWEGIDGTRVFTHFPPVDTYNSNLSAEELDRAATNFADKGLANVSLAPFGYGDGGGGPNREMLRQAHRTANLEGSPQVLLSTPELFFAEAREEYADDAPTWLGEMYLEYHRGTYTSQQRTKRGNRRSESLLHEAELWATAATVQTDAAYPYAELQSAWQTVLLQQFHDILPGSSIAWVHREAEENYAKVEANLDALIVQSLVQLVGGGADGQIVMANASPIARSGVPGLAIKMAAGAGNQSQNEIVTDSEGWILSNEGATVKVDRNGLVSSAVEMSSGREAIPVGTQGNLLQFFRDIPNNWEAWDIEKHYRRNQTDLVEADLIEVTQVDSGMPALRIRRSFSGSTVEQLLWLAAGNDPTLHIETTVDWHEKQKLLKLAFPVDVQTAASQSETQFGFVERSTHENTTWDAAQFETVAHRWVRVEEPGFAVSLANDATYGHDITRIRVGNRPATQIRVSLLRAPLFPDPVADQGTHQFHHTLTLGSSVEAAYAQGYALNLPLRQIRGSVEAASISPLVSVEREDEEIPFFVEAIKLASDESGDVIVRLFEPRGAKVSGELSINFDHQSVQVVDLLERPVGQSIRRVDGSSVEIALHPFEVLSLRIRR